MGTDTKIAVDQPGMTGANPKPPRDKVMRIAAMTKQILDEVRTQPLDTASLHRLRTIDTQIIGELLTDLTPDLRQELQRLALPLSRHTELSDAELRLAHAQLVGWLQGLLQTARTALSDPRVVLANDPVTVQAAELSSTSNDIPTSPNHFDRPHIEPGSPIECLPDDIALNEHSDHVEAAAIPIVGLTAWQALVDTAYVLEGTRVLINGAAGGVGHVAVQIAKVRGAYVIALTSAANADFVRSLGADQVIDYAAVDFTEVVADVDVVLEVIGGDYPQGSGSSQARRNPRFDPAPHCAAERG